MANSQGPACTEPAAKGQTDNQDENCSNHTNNEGVECARRRTYHSRRLGRGAAGGQTRSWIVSRLWGAGCALSAVAVAGSGTAAFGSTANAAPPAPAAHVLASREAPPEPPLEPPAPSPPQHPSRHSHASGSGEGHGGSLNIREGETHEGDLYRFAESITIAGTQSGDLFAMARSVTVTGKVAGDLLFFGQTADLGGTIGDSVRVWVKNVTVTGTIDGDLLAFAASVNVAPGAHIKGRLSAYGGSVVVNGTVDHDVKAKAGQVEISGKVGGDADVVCDQLDIDPKARIEGDLSYETRKPLDVEGKGIVGGEIQFKERRKGEHKRERLISGWKVFKGAFLLCASLVAGLMALALFGGPSRSIVGAITGDPLRSTAIGFLTLIVVPIAAALSCVLIVTIPLAIIVFMLYALTVYLSKLPVAVWVGQKILGRTGRPEPSPYSALAIGLVLLYLVFWIPYVGKLAWFVCVFVGLGAIVMGGWSGLQQQRPGTMQPAATPSPPSSSPAGWTSGPPGGPPPAGSPPAGPITFGS